MFNRFADRREGGRALAAKLLEYQNRTDVVVLALPRGGVPVAFEVAGALKAPLDVLIVRKLGIPGHEELAFGAIASGDVIFLNRQLLDDMQLPDDQIERVIAKERRELARRENLYRIDGAGHHLEDKTVIIVDDGLATGATMRAAIAAVRVLRPQQIIAAAPVASRLTCAELTEQSGVCCICALAPEPFYGVGMWYDDFEQTTDEEVRNLVASAAGIVSQNQLAA
jgi:putative phosphoribosyl transferase